jgi:hypothetical protein
LVSSRFFETITNSKDCLKSRIKIYIPAFLLSHWSLVGDGWLSNREMGGLVERWVAKEGRWVSKVVMRLLTKEALYGSNPGFLKNTKWVTKAKEWPTLSSPPKKYNFFPVLVMTSFQNKFSGSYVAFATCSF